MNYRHMPLKRLCSLVLAMITLMAPVSALADYKAIVNSSSRVYSAPSASASSAKVAKGTIVTVKDTNDGVAKISRNGKIGYMESDDLSRVKVTRTAVAGKVYRSPSTKAKAISIAKGASVNLIGVNGNWAFIERGGNTGYVKKTILEPYYDASGKKESVSKAEIVISAAMAKIGCDYEYACSGPSKFDCSGLVKYAYKKVGITMSVNAYQQGYGDGTKIGYKDLKPGDLVCFNTNAGDGDLSDHTGIYIGGGKFVHASSGSGEVMVSTLTSGYYQDTFSWGRRIL